jgi:protein-S-isoprenylcysteine O-methyltransferase Ste14
VGTAGYLGLAVLGFGGLAAFFSHPALTALVVATFVLACTSLFAGGNVNPGVREDRRNHWVLVAFALIGLLDAYLPAYTDRKEFWTIDGDTIRWLGVVLFAVGGALRLWPVFVLLTALIVVPVLVRIRAEEQLLRTQFGDEHGAYCARTSRLIRGFY